MLNKILVIDDELEICEILVSILSDEGFDVSSATNADTALEMVSKDSYPLIISDISMPGLSGLQFLAKVRERGIPSAVVMLTAHSEKERIIEALQLGAIDYLNKPFEAAELVNKTPVWMEIGRRLSSMIENSDGSIEAKVRMIELFKLKNHKNTKKEL